MPPSTISRSSTSNSRRPSQTGIEGGSGEEQERTKVSDYLARIQDGLSNNSVDNDSEMGDLDQYDGVQRLYIRKDTSPPLQDGYDAVRVLSIEIREGC